MRYIDCKLQNYCQPLILKDIQDISLGPLIDFEGCIVLHPGTACWYQQTTNIEGFPFHIKIQSFK